ncbi:MAG: ATPase [Thaumarchaeota archaeon]|nr:ATPase [Nitrososphaerota archaeon]
MAIAELLVGSVILPRTESPQAVSRLAEFEWFHKIETENETITPELDDLLLRSQKIYQTIEEVVKGLNVPPIVGMMEILFKGTQIKQKKYELKELESIIEDVKKKTPLVIGDATKLLEEDTNTRKSLEEYTSLKETLQLVKKLNIDIGDFGLMKYFFINFFVIKTSDYDEIIRTLEGVAIYKYELESKENSALVIISDVKDADKVTRVMRSLNANPFSIPQGFPQVPSKAYALAESKIKELTVKQKSITKQLSMMRKKLRVEILTLQEDARVAKDIFETLRKPGGTKHFALIQGYIPKKMEKRFKDITGQWTSTTEEIKDPKTLEELPVLLRNPRWVRTFEVITNSQGIPKRGEPDPTWMIALMWPIFYGIMFADLGHALLLMGFGLLFKVKGQGTLSRWGMLIAISGFSAAIAGLFTGEMFGFHLDQIAPIAFLIEEGGPLHFMAGFIGLLSVAELTFEQVIMILKVSIFLGIIHLVWAFLLRIKRYYREGRKVALYFEAIPNFIMYFGIVAVMMSAIGSGYDVMGMYSKIHTEPVPWITILVGDWAVVWLVVRIAIITVIGCIIVMIVGGIIHNKKHPEEGGDMASIVMETLLGKTVECLSHTISYSRIGIMLLVHAALLLTVNNAYVQLGGIGSLGALAIIIGGNLGIMIIEGLIVYIQSLRLHLYEFFTKWYDGGATPFKKLVPEMIYNKLVWKE